MVMSLVFEKLLHAGNNYTLSLAVEPKNSPRIQQTSKFTLIQIYLNETCFSQLYCTQSVNNPPFCSKTFKCLPSGQPCLNEALLTLMLPNYTQYA